MIVLTTSRNSLVCVAIAICILAPWNKFKFGFISLSFIGGICLINLIPFLSLSVQNSIYKFIPSSLLVKTSIATLSDMSSFPRLEIWTKSLDLIRSNLFIGYGGGSFSSIYNINNGKFEGIQHTHNIFLELAFNYGIIASILITSTMLFILFKCSKKYIFNKRDSYLKINTEGYDFNKPWITSFLIFFFLHLFDITYFDGRISLLSWILLAGMLQIIKEKEL